MYKIFIVPRPVAVPHSVPLCLKIAKLRSNGRRATMVVKPLRTDGPRETTRAIHARKPPESMRAAMVPNAMRCALTCTAAILETRAIAKKDVIT